MNKLLQGFMTSWDVQEMPAKNRSYHIIKHVYNYKECWWEVGSWFTRKHINRFNQELNKRKLSINLKKDPKLQKLISSLPQTLHQELNDVYEQEYKRITLNVLKNIDHEDTLFFNQYTEKHGLTAHFYTKQNILIILKSISVERNELYWATSYRPYFSQNASHPKKLERFVSNLKESELY